MQPNCIGDFVILDTWDRDAIPVEWPNAFHYADWTDANAQADPARWVNVGAGWHTMIYYRGAPVSIYLYEHPQTHQFWTEIPPGPFTVVEYDPSDLTHIRQTRVFL